MGFFFAFMAILGESSAKTIDKLNFRRNHITFQQMMLLIFAGMTGSLLAFILITRQPFPHLQAAAIGLLALIALVSFGGNVFDTLSLRFNDLSLREPMVDFEPIMAGLIGYALFPSERKPLFLAAFALGTLIVYWGSHRRKLRRMQKKGMSYLILAVVFYGFLPSIYKLTLTYISPTYIAFFRVAAILVLTAIFLRVKKVRKLNSKKVSYSLVSSVIYAVEAVASIYAIEKLGVVLTMLLLMVGPALRYYSGYFVLKEKVRTGEMISSFMLILVVVVALIK